MLKDAKQTFVSSYEDQSDETKALIKAFILGLIRGATAAGKPFTVSDLVGGRFKNWGDNPLDNIYQYQVDRGSANPERESAKDVGRLFKNFMIEDSFEYVILGKVQRTFPTSLYALKTIAG